MIKQELSRGVILGVILLQSCLIVDGEIPKVVIALLLNLLMMLKISFVEKSAESSWCDGSQKGM